MRQRPGLNYKNDRELGTLEREEGREELLSNVGDGGDQAAV